MDILDNYCFILINTLFEFKVNQKSRTIRSLKCKVIENDLYWQFFL